MRRFYWVLVTAQVTVYGPPCKNKNKIVLQMILFAFHSKIPQLRIFIILEINF